MARYVDIECDAVTEVLYRRAFKSREDIKEFLDNIPTVDVVKVKHGEWVKPECETLYRLYSGNKCSECGFVYCGDKTPYCPNCGAKMDGGNPK